MGFFSKKSESYEVGDAVAALAAAKNNSERNKVLKEIKGGKYTMTAKQIREAEKLAKRCSEGELGTSAFIAGMKGGGTNNQNYKNIPLRDRVHPAEYRRILEREAKKQGLL